ncbi:hypothetical protein VP1G_04456 [Cytospora mali]|uniref:N-acetyltransferase domain-containing protein n=1 Tax=Cytospora mali TaxID=578113 RepID=A0A194UZK7_CYTMA|nr:hypothetical protein VP1G_04456 [Valsa mali var. pyri (nom. inval.)]
MTSPENTGQLITIRTTTRILPPSSSRPPTTTPHLLLRPLAASDLEAFYALRRQQEVMQWTTSGRIDENKEDTATRLAVSLPPNDTQTFNCAICLRGTGELVGVGGVLRVTGEKLTFGWPEVGYMLRREVWGKGFATEFLRAFLVMWEELPREVVERRVDVSSLVRRVEDGAAESVPEELIATIDGTNGASQRVLEKCGFQKFLVFEEADTHDPERMKESVAYRYLPQDKTVGAR